MPINLSDRQQQTVSTAITLVSGLAIATVVFGLIVALTRFVSYFAGVLMPLVAAAMVALLLKPYQQWLQSRCRLSRVLSVVVVFASVVIPVVILAWVFGAVIVQQLSGLVARVPEAIAAIRNSIAEHRPAVVEFWETSTLAARLRTAMEGHWAVVVRGFLTAGEGAVSAGASVIRGFTALVGWAVFPVYLAFLLMAGPRKWDGYEDLFPFLKKETRDDVVYLIREFVDIVVAFFRGQIIIALAQAVLLAIGFTLVGLQYGFVLGFMLGLLNIIPYLGSILGLAVALPIAFFQADGGTWTVVWVLVVFGAVQTIEGYVLTPRIMGERTGLHPMAIIFAMFFWGTAFGGIMGMIFAIPLTAFLVVFWRLARKKYIKEVV